MSQKIKIFSYDTKSDSKAKIESEINEFIKDKEIIDIKVNTDIATITEVTGNIQILMVTIIVIYKAY